jgi:hypothetical protein
VELPEKGAKYATKKYSGRAQKVTHKKRTTSEGKNSNKRKLWQRTKSERRDTFCSVKRERR